MESADSLDLSLLSEGDSDDLADADLTGSSRKRTADDAGLDYDGRQEHEGSGDPDLQLQQAGPDDQDKARQQRKKKQKRVLSEQRLKRVKEQHAKRGIVYMSRIPPHMKPGKVRQLLSQYGEIGRIYCTPEDPTVRHQRKKTGGNTGKNFTEGWIEFEDKSVAKQVAATLNGQQIGGKKRSDYHFDLWNLKYLPKFKWDHLTEEIAYEKAVREQKLANELSAAKRERDFYLSQVDKAKAVQAIKQRREGRASAEAAAVGQGAATQQGAAAGAGGASGSRKTSAPTAKAAPAQQPDPQGKATQPAAAAAADGADPGGSRPTLLRHFGQRKAKDKSSSGGPAGMADQVLALVAGR